jgi:Helicase HerA, central domain
MNDDERAALSALSSFDWAMTYEDVWAPLEGHVEALNGRLAHNILATFAETGSSHGRSPLGVVITGQKGSGKTHLLAWTRNQVQLGGGYFFLVGLLQGKGFWPNIVYALIAGLHRPGSNGDDQLTVLLQGLCDKAGVPASVRAEVTGARPVTREGLDEFTGALRRLDPRMGRECRYTARALALLNADDPATQDTGEGFLTSQEEAEPGEWAAWGLRPPIRPPQQITTELSWLLATTGPSLLAIDQIDTLIAQSARPDDLPSPHGTATGEQITAGRTAISDRDVLAEEVGGGLMELREKTRRTLIVVTCLVRTWELIQQQAVDTVTDRFRADRRLERIPSAEVGLALVEARFRPRFASVRFTPPYPTWPVLPEALTDAPRFTPRGLMRRIDAHVHDCLRLGAVRPLARFEETFDELPPPELTQMIAETGRVVGLDAKFNSLRAEADTTAAVASLTEDAAMPPLLSAGLHAFVLEQGADGEAYSLDAPPGRSPAWHAGLHRSLDESSDDELHWAFRAIAGPHHSAIGNRVERIRVIAGLDPAVRKRKAFVLRTGSWKVGPKTQQKINEFEASGGVILPLEPEDLSVFWALQVMLDKDRDPALPAWLRQRRPASRTKLFTTVFGPPGLVPGGAARDGMSPGPGTGRDPADGADAAQSYPLPAPAPAVAALAIGTVLDAVGEAAMGSAIEMPLAALRKHAVIFAGSGSGKTVLLRRLVEECALQGVSSIVLDPNNDLARLGDAWPEPPAGWGDGDAAKAAAYLAGTEVVIWTPRRETGRPLSFQPLPDFAAVLDDPDEFALALDTAVAALAPRARMTAATAKAERGRAVLREALAYFARHGGSGLTTFVDLLAELPDDVTPLAKARAMAEDMAQTLTAAMINDPLFGGSGVPLDPGVLLTPPPGWRARVSVISFVGLPGNEQRQSFVNQLQMALFAWIKRHPASGRPLGGLLVMDEAQTLAPSGAMTASTESTLALASQARKYGLGLIFATQAPRGIHNRIVGNAATQFYGFLNSPTQIAAAKEMAAAKASVIVDISRLSAGQFYAVGEGLPFQKVAMPMCLSYHPASALTAEEVLARASCG